MTKEQASASYKEAAAIVAKLSTADSATYAEMIKNTGGTSLIDKAPLACALASAESKAKE